MGTRLWWLPVLAGVVALGLSTLIDQWLSIRAQMSAPVVRKFMSVITDLGLSDWTLIPSLALFVLAAVLALLMRSRPMLATALWQVAAPAGFIFAAVAVP